MQKLKEQETHPLLQGTRTSHSRLPLQSRMPSRHKGLGLFLQCCVTMHLSPRTVRQAHIGAWQKLPEARPCQCSCP